MRGRTRTRVGPHVCCRFAWPAVTLTCALVLCAHFTAAGAAVTTHDPGKAFAGYNLRVSHDPPGAVLMDMDGNALHEWTCRFKDAFPAVAVPEEPGFSDRWTNVRLLPDGDILGIFGGLGLARLDRSSRIVWAHEGGEHDDIAVTEAGEIYVLGSAKNRADEVNGVNRAKRVGQREPIIEDYVLVLEANGNLANRVSLRTATLSSDFHNITKAARMERSGHVLHANSLQVLDGSLSGRIPSFGNGTILVSFRGLDTIAVVDMESESLVWTQFGMWLDQLDATLLSNGNMLLLEYVDDDPKVIEFDPVTMEVKWAYQRNSGSPVDTRWGGSCQRLPNGNTLISESGRGRAFEVTPQGEVVWEYASSGDGDVGGAAATPFELTRIDPEFPMDWLGN